MLLVGVEDDPMRAQNLAPNPAPNLAQNLARNLAYVFDHSGKVRRPSLRLTLGEVRSLVPFGGCAPDATGIANGRGHVVLLVPGWFTTDGVNRSLQEFLTVCGYRAFGWKLGMNWGPTPRLIRGLEERLAELRELEGGPVSVVGLSLGGVLARDLGHRCPRDVRQVITIASPFRLPTASRLEPLFQLLSRWYAPEFDVVRLSTPLPMPATA